MKTALEILIKAYVISSAICLLLGVNDWSFQWESLIVFVLMIPFDVLVYLSAFTMIIVGIIFSVAILACIISLFVFVIEALRGN